MIDFSKLFIDDNIQPYFENLKTELNRTDAQIEELKQKID